MQMEFQIIFIFILENLPNNLAKTFVPLSLELNNPAMAFEINIQLNALLNTLT